MLCQWPDLLSSCVSILWQLTCLHDLGLLGSLSVSLSWSGFNLPLWSAIVMMIETGEQPLSPANIMDMSMNPFLSSSVEHLSLSSGSWDNSQGSDTTLIHKLTPQPESLIMTRLCWALTPLPCQLTQVIWCQMMMGWSPSATHTLLCKSTLSLLSP